MIGASRPRGLRIALVCSGLGRVARGFERFFHELAATLRGHVDACLYGAAPPPGLVSHAVPSLSRGTLTRLGVDPERAYYLEQLTFAAALVPYLAAFRPHVIHVSDPALTNALLRLRSLVPGRPALLYCNGGPLTPQHYRRYDHVQLVAPWQLEQARAWGIDPLRVTFVPHGIDVRRFQGLPSQADARMRLRLPGGLVAITVAALNASTKRVDYVIREMADARAHAWTLVCLGQRTGETPALEALAARVAKGRVVVRTAAPDDVPLYLAASDLFVLASASEGFGLAAAEAMAAGLPVVVRNIPSLRYLVDDDEQIDRLDDPGALAAQLVAVSSDAAVRRARGDRNRTRAARMFDWSAVLPAYLDLYAKVGSARR